MESLTKKENELRTLAENGDYWDILELADFLYDELGAKSVAVIIEAEHLCMTMRGAKAAGAKTETSALRGYVRNDAKLRAEVMSLLTGGR